MKAEPFVTGLSFGEGLRWHQGRFWYSDFYKHHIASAGPGSDARVEVEIEDQPSGLGWLPDGRLLFVSMKNQKVMRREANGRIVQHADLSGLATFHCNDMVVDRHGNAFVGCFGFDLDKYMADNGPAAVWTAEGPPRAPLMRVTPDGKASVAAADIRFPNGTVIINSGKTLVVAETFGPSLTAFDLAADGALTNRRLWASLRTDPPSIAPDGTCADSENCIWVANALAKECVRVAEGGKILERVETSMNAFACALGGPDGRSLVIATAQSHGAGNAVEGMLEFARVCAPV